VKLSQLYDRWSLAQRIVVVSLLLLLVVQAAVFVAVRISIDTTVGAQVAQELEVAEGQWARLLDQNAQKLRQNASLQAQDFGFLSALSSDDTATIRSALDNTAQRVSASISALLDSGLQIRTLGSGQDAAALPPVLKTLTEPLSRNTQGSQIALIDGKVYQFVMVPIKRPVVVGWILMGFKLDQTLANDMRTLSGGIHVVMMRPPDQGPGEVMVSTLPESASQTLLHDDNSGQLPYDGDTLIIRRVKQQSLVGEVRTLLLASLNEAVAPFHKVQIALGLITLLGLLLFAIGSAFTAGRIATPLRALVADAERLGSGDYGQAVHYTERHDEIGDLAKAFDQMRLDIANQQDEIIKLAYWDPLTGLPNRARFREAVQRAIAQKGLPTPGPATASNRTPQATLAVVMLDLDRFKHVNDVLGYSYGDRLLKAVAERLSAQIRAVDDMVARLGGDEFAVLLSHSDTDNAITVAGRIAKSFELPLAFDDNTVDLSAGIGIACWPTHAADADMLLSRAEAAMYSAKRKTTDVQLYDPDLDSSSNQTLSLLTELRRAVEQGELRLYLQPKISLNDNRVVAAEALVRWQHPQRGLLAPIMFIPFAEQTGFIRQITLWMFEEVARSWAKLQAPGQALRVAINLSTRDLLDQEFPAKLDILMARHGVTAQGFCLEITESAIMDDPQRAEATLNRLAERGFKLSIDDFGTGYSSLAYLKRLPVDELKIDKSFVMGMEDSQDDAKIVRSTIDLAHNLSLTVVAEGVENAAVWDQLKALSCDEAQGYHMSKPLALADFTVWCQQRTERALA
jgi:diguanylate cyclase (GGDEF)-like protein